MVIIEGESIDGPIFTIRWPTDKLIKLNDGIHISFIDLELNGKLNIDTDTQSNLNW